MDVKGNIETALKRALSKLGIEVEVALDHPADISHGDYSCNVALACAKKAGKNPKVLAEEILKELGAIEGVESVSLAGAGFLNFKLSKDFFPQSIAQILSCKYICYSKVVIHKYLKFKSPLMRASKSFFFSV
jgi:arginyl-tRNA synthetase